MDDGMMAWWGKIRLEWHLWGDISCDLWQILGALHKHSIRDNGVTRRGDILRRSSATKWQVGSLKTQSFKVLSILRDGILMEISKSLVEKGLKLNKQKKMCPTTLLFMPRREQLECFVLIRPQTRLTSWTQVLFSKLTHQHLTGSSLKDALKS